MTDTLTTWAGTCPFCRGPVGMRFDTGMFNRDRGFYYIQCEPCGARMASRNSDESRAVDLAARWDFWLAGAHPLPTDTLRAALGKALPAVRVCIAAVSLGHVDGRIEYWEALESEIGALLRG